MGRCSLPNRKWNRAVGGDSIRLCHCHSYLLFCLLCGTTCSMAASFSGLGSFLLHWSRRGATGYTPPFLSSLSSHVKVYAWHSSSLFWVAKLPSNCGNEEGAPCGDQCPCDVGLALFRSTHIEEELGLLLLQPLVFLQRTILYLWYSGDVPP